jgi:hypothetical protein
MWVSSSCPPTAAVRSSLSTVILTLSVVERERITAFAFAFAVAVAVAVAVAFAVAVVLRRHPERSEGPLYLPLQLRLPLRLPVLRRHPERSEGPLYFSLQLQLQLHMHSLSKQSVSRRNADPHPPSPLQKPAAKPKGRLDTAVTINTEEKKARL